MPDTAPVIGATYHEDGSVSITQGEQTAVIPAHAVAQLGAFNWAAILQMIMTYGPQLIALIVQIINGFKPAPTPTPTPSPLPTPGK